MGPSQEGWEKYIPGQESGEVIGDCRGWGPGKEEREEESNEGRKQETARSGMFLLASARVWNYWYSRDRFGVERGVGKEQLKAEGTVSELTWAFRVKLRPEVQVWPDNRKTQDLEWVGSHE